MSLRSRYHLLYPEDRYVSAKWILSMAHQLALDGEIPGGFAGDVESAISQLEGAGLAVFTQTVFSQRESDAQCLAASCLTVESTYEPRYWTQITADDF